MLHPDGHLLGVQLPASGSAPGPRGRGLEGGGSVRRPGPEFACDDQHPAAPVEKDKFEGAVRVGRDLERVGDPRKHRREEQSLEPSEPVRALGQHSEAGEDRERPVGHRPAEGGGPRVGPVRVQRVHIAAELSESLHLFCTDVDGDHRSRSGPPTGAPAARCLSTSRARTDPGPTSTISGSGCPSI